MLSRESQLLTRRRLQHLCLDKAYISEQEEQELIKRGYVLHIPNKKKKGEEDIEERTKVTSNRKKHSPKRWVVERIHGITGSGNCLPDMRKNLIITLDWYSSLVV